MGEHRRALEEREEQKTNLRAPPVNQRTEVQIWRCTGSSHIKVWTSQKTFRRIVYQIFIHHLTVFLIKEDFTQQHTHLVRYICFSHFQNETHQSWRRKGEEKWVFDIHMSMNKIQLLYVNTWLFRIFPTSDSW